LFSEASLFVTDEAGTRGNKHETQQLLTTSLVSKISMVHPSHLGMQAVNVMGHWADLKN
jgi:hypothetical protein